MRGHEALPLLDEGEKVGPLLRRQVDRVFRLYLCFFGAGTFQPVKVDDLAQHRMHAERVVVPEATVAAVARARAGEGACPGRGGTPSPPRGGVTR